MEVAVSVRTGIVYWFDRHANTRSSSSPTNLNLHALATSRKRLDSSFRCLHHGGHALLHQSLYPFTSHLVLLLHDPDLIHGVV